MNKPPAIPATPADNIVKGAMFMMGFCLFAPIMDAFAKHLSYTLPIMQIVWARFFMHMLIAVPFAFIHNRKALFRPSRLSMQLVRSILLMMATICFFTGLKHMPIANNLVFAFISPFIVTAISGLFLREKVGIRRWSAVAIGFCGVLIILQPGTSAFNQYAIFPMGTGFLYAFYVILTRKMAGADPPLVTLAYTSVTGAILMTLYLAFSGDWKLPAQTLDWGLMLMLGFWAMLSHLCLIRAFDYASATVLSPFLYFEIVLATILGYLWFADFPELTTWAGMAVIVTSGIYISWREHMLAKRKHFKERH